MTTPLGGPKKSSKKSAAHKKKIAKAQDGKKNSNFKHGARVDYRKKLNLKKGDGKVVSHLNHDRSDNRRSNLKILNDPPKKGTKRVARKTTPLHERYHSKTNSRGAGRPKGS